MSTIVTNMIDSADKIRIGVGLLCCIVLDVPVEITVLLPTFLLRIC
jgi:hypothetical protein